MTLMSGREGWMLRQANSSSLLYKRKKEQPCLRAVEHMLSPGKCYLVKGI